MWAAMWVAGWAERKACYSVVSMVCWKVEKKVGSLVSVKVVRLACDLEGHLDKRQVDQKAVWLVGLWARRYHTSLGVPKEWTKVLRWVVCLGIMTADGSVA